MSQRRNGCGCLLLLVIVGAVLGGPTIFGKTEDAVVTAPAPGNSGPSSSASTSSPPPSTSARKSAPKTTAAASKATRAPLPPARVPKVTTAPAKSPRTAAVPLPEVPQAEVPDAPAAYYANCTAARAAGAAPLYRGQPGYRSALDRDNDGVACET
jgi:hypothetical protein